MGRTLTITVDLDVYDGLSALGDGEAISRLLNALARPHVVPGDVARGYDDMRADAERETEAREWSETLVGDVAEDRPIDG